MGRPAAEYSQEIADKICAGIIEGYSLRTVCKDESLPCVTVVLGWLRTKPEFTAQYTRAKEEQADALAEEMLDIADNAVNDWMIRTGKDGEDLGWQLNGDHVRRSHLRIETRKWLASKLKPKKYGVDRVDVTSGDQPLTKLIVGVDPEKMFGTDSEPETPSTD